MNSVVPTLRVFWRRPLIRMFITLWTSGGGLVLSAYSQSSHMPAYEGANPELIEGIEPDTLVERAPRVRHVYLAAPDILALVVDDQAIVTPPLRPYEPRPGDTIARSRPQPYGQRGRVFYWNRAIMRDGKSIGWVHGPKEDHYTPHRTLVGERIPPAWMESPLNYEVSSSSNTDGAERMRPLSIGRKTRSETMEWTDKGRKEGTGRHELFLRLPKPLTPGKKYTVTFGEGGPLSQPVRFLFDDTRLRTEAIQVNQVGYHPQQSEKIALLFQWMGSGGGVDFSALPSFVLVEHTTGRRVFTGEIRLVAAGDPNRVIRREPGDSDVLPAPLYTLDFSTFSEPGVYRVVVPGLGASFPFRIDHTVYRDAAKMAAHGFFNQRSGLALGPPHTKYTRPRNFHPEDGVPIYRTDPAIFFDPVRFPEPSGNSFKRIQAAIIDDQTEPRAWGGWHDAADYDRSVLPQDHMRAVHAMLDLHTADPAYFAALNLNLPESSNRIPDIVDEALWCMELFRRIQQENGGVPSAVESTEHPSEPSYLLGQPTAVTPPTPQTCHVYAAAAAHLALVLQAYDAELAAAYRESAVRAMAWAAQHPEVPNIYSRKTRPAEQYANLAAFWMYRLTGEQNWHDEFRRTFEVLERTPRMLDLAFADFNGPWGFVFYALLGDDDVDVALRQRCRDALLRSADRKADRTLNWPFGVGPQSGPWGERLGVSWELSSAHRLTGDAKYLRAIERQVQYVLGRNPLNSSFITGLGSRAVRPFLFDPYYLGVPLPEGLSSYGTSPPNMWRGRENEADLNIGGLYPEWSRWPWAESFFNARIPDISEYTVGGSIANRLLSLAYLAQALERKGR